MTTGEPLRDQVITALIETIEIALAAPHAWGTFPASRRIDRRPLVLTQMGDRLRILVLDDDGSRTPMPDTHDADVDDRLNLLIVVQVNDPAQPSRWGHRALDVIKRALRESSAAGPLALYTKHLIEYEEEGVYLPTDQVGRYAEYVLPCTLQIPDNLGGFWPSP